MGRRPGVPPGVKLDMEKSMLLIEALRRHKDALNKVPRSMSEIADYLNASKELEFDVNKHMLRRRMDIAGINCLPRNGADKEEKAEGSEDLSAVVDRLQKAIDCLTETVNRLNDAVAAFDPKPVRPFTIAQPG